MRTKRRCEVYEIIANAGWHFTYLGGVEKIIQKLEAFSHSEFNLNEFKDERNILKLIKDGKDLFGRDIEFEIVDEDYKFPKYLKSKEGLDKFKDFFYK